jgi:hypothetical protein
MKRLIPLLLLAFVLFSSHDMYLKLDSYFLQPNSASSIKLFNGTFAESDNVIARDRMADVSLVGNGIRTAVDTAQWSEQDRTTLLSFTTGAAGTWVAGLSTLPRNIEMDAEAFNGYLEHDGVLDMLEWRKTNDALGLAAVEKYAKHIKAIFQVGDKKTADWQTNLGYPIEFIPRENPYDLHSGDELKVQLLWQGKPLANQVVTVDSDNKEHSHGDDHDHADEAGHSHDEAAKDHYHHGDNLVRTDANGELTIPLANDGIWFLRTIHLVESDASGLTHESNWATLTFEVGHSHSDDAHAAAANTHSHDGGEAHSHDDEAAHSHGDAEGEHMHDEEGGIPSYVFWVGSLFVIGGLFFFFSRKEA